MHLSLTEKYMKSCANQWLAVQMSLASSEDKLSASEVDMRQLRASMREYEALVDEYRQQVRSTHYVCASHVP